jgi:hypothetical protein
VDLDGNTLETVSNRIPKQSNVFWVLYTWWQKGANPRKPLSSIWETSVGCPIVRLSFLSNWTRFFFFLSLFLNNHSRRMDWLNPENIGFPSTMSFQCFEHKLKLWNLHLTTLKMFMVCVTRGFKQARFIPNLWLDGVTKPWRDD